MESVAFHWVPGHGRAASWDEAGIHYNPASVINQAEVRTMPKCAFCGAELEPPVRALHTIYMKSLYRIGGQDYCRHHVIITAVALGVITEVKPGQAPTTTQTPASGGRLKCFLPWPTFSNTDNKPSDPVQPSRSNSLHPETVGRNGFTKLLW